MPEKIEALLKADDLSALYALSEGSELSDDERLELQAEIMERAREGLHIKISEKRLLDFDEEHEHFVLRVLYENALAFFEAGESYESQEAFSLLCESSNSRHFQKAMRKHLLALFEKVSFDTFVQEWIADETPKHFFVSRFVKAVEKKFSAQEATLAMATQRYAKLFK